MDTRAVLDHQYEAFGAGSADEIVKDFAEDAVMVGPEGVAKGTAAIHAKYSELFAGIFKPGTYELLVDAEHVEGPIAYIAWRLKGATADVNPGTDTFVVWNGKIIAQTFLWKVDPK
jgi:ketosteroid isomerase-like protein